MRIDLTFALQSKLVAELGVYTYLHLNCHHQIVFARFSLIISYPLPYFREVWYYRESNTDLIRRTVNEFHWEKAFCNTNVNKKVYILNKTMLNVLYNYIPHFWNFDLRWKRFSWLRSAMKKTLGLISFTGWK